MKVLVDPAIFAYGQCGMTRYYAAVCRGLEERGASIALPLVFSRVDHGLAATGVAKRLRWFAGRLARFPMALRLFDSASKYLFYQSVRRGDYDQVLVTSPDFSDRLLRYREDVPFAMIVHDTMSSVTVPDALVDSCGPAHQRLLYLAARARVIVCISEATRQDLLAFAPLDGRRVATVLSANMLQPTIAAWYADLPARFLLFVGERSGRKSFDLLVRSLPAVLARHPEVKLVVTGALSRWELDFLRRWGVEEAVIGIAADDTTLQALYRQAVCLVYPSLYEGFGLPPLEAMSLGCPVIATAARATREICGEAALLVPPLDGTALEAAILRLLDEPELRQQLGQSGKMQAGRFAFTRMMDEMNNVLRQAV